MRLTVNGDAYELDAPVDRTLAETLRDELGLTGTKVACGEGHCGACTVLLDGAPHLSCITLVHTVGSSEVTTIEGLRDHPLVDAFVRCDALQCGFCTPGQIVSASALVAANPEPIAGRDPPRDGGQPLPLRHVPADRGGDLDMARLVRTEKEIEGRIHRDVGRRRGGRARPVAVRSARLRRPARAEGRRLRAGTRRGSLHRRRPPPGDAAHGDAPQPARAGTRAPARPLGRRGGARGARGARAGRRRSGSRTSRSTRARRSPPWPPRRSRRRRPAVALADVEWEVLEPLLDPVEAARTRLARRRQHLLARRRPGGLRRGGQRRRGRVPDPDAQPQLSRDAPGGLRMARRRHRRLHLDPGDLGRPRRRRVGVRPVGGQGSRRLRVHGRRLRLEGERRPLHPDRRRAGAENRAARAPRADAPRGERRQR